MGYEVELNERRYIYGFFFKNDQVGIDVSMFLPLSCSIYAVIFEDENIVVSLV